MEGKAKPSIVCTMERGGGEEQADRRREAMERSSQSVAMSVFMPLPQPQSVLISVACVATKGHLDAIGVGCCLRPC